MCEMLATYALQLIIKFSLSFAMPYILLYVKALSQHKILALFLSAAVGR